MLAQNDLSGSPQKISNLQVSQLMGSGTRLIVGAKHSQKTLVRIRISGLLWPEAVKLIKVNGRSLEKDNNLLISSQVGFGEDVRIPVPLRQMVGRWLAGTVGEKDAWSPSSNSALLRFADGATSERWHLFRFGTS